MVCRSFRKNSCKTLLAALCLFFLALPQAFAAEKPNVLMILVDDLKPALGCYGDSIAKTPNIDALAARGMRFDLAYCNQAVCAPSRFTLMLGSHSTSTGLYGLGSQLRQIIPNAVTLPQYFAKHGGYRTESLGKVFHIGHGNLGDPTSFSVPHFHDKVIEYLEPASTDGGKLTREEAYFTNQMLGKIRSLPRGAAYENPTAADTDYADGRVAAEAVKRLRAARQRREKDGTPFFIVTGFARPHLPFSAPKKYWDMYDPTSLPMPKHEELPINAPTVAGKRGGEISNYKPVPTDRNAKFSEDLKRQLIHGYYASCSFVDAQIGKVIEELDRLKLQDDTIVVLWGDHGFHLGDLGIWTKHTNYEQATRIPILISAPGVTNPNSSTKQLAESVDIFPTLAELAGLPIPDGPQSIDGVSLVPALKNPAARVRGHAYHVYPKRKLGRAIRNERHRLVEWRAIGGSKESAEYELYDYQTDPKETRNLAASKPEVVKELKAILATYPRPVSRNPRAAPPKARKNGDGSMKVSGELKQWHKVTLTLNGPFADERDKKPNPFRDIMINVTLQHESGQPEYFIPMYFAADGNAANTGATSGNKWRAHLSPDKPGKWSYYVVMLPGVDIHYRDEDVKLASPAYGTSDTFTVASSDKSGRDFRAKGRLQYVGRHYLRHAGSGDYFLKAGPDAPETLLAYTDFDNTIGTKKNAPLKSWKPHVRDWREGDPTWKNGRGKGLIGALNYLHSKGCNTVSFLPYNAGGDGNNVWPFVSRNQKLHYDCSKLDQWQIVFDHATKLGIHLHFKLQENEIDDNRRGHKSESGVVPESLDGGKLGVERMVYCREMVARFGHELGLLWNIGEENTQSPEEQRDMIAYLRGIDPYQHNIVIHSFPQQQDKVYNQLLGEKSQLTGASLQNSWRDAHAKTLKWRRASAAAGRPWVVCNDEQTPATHGVPPDPGYEGHDGFAVQKGQKYDLHDIRKYCLWGTLMAGGGGVEYYFGYKLPQNDLVCQDFRSRDRSWDYCRVALDFFRDQSVPLAEMRCMDELVSNKPGANDRYCFAKPGQLYLVYLPKGGTSKLDLAKAEGEFRVEWFNPRSGGKLTEGSVKKVTGGQSVSLGQHPRDVEQDWLVVVRAMAE